MLAQSLINVAILVACLIIRSRPIDEYHRCQIYAESNRSTSGSGTHAERQFEILKSSIR